VQIVRHNTLSLQKLIEDLLAYHQTRAMEPAAQGPVALSDIVNRVVKTQRLAALARMVTFKASMRPATVIADEERLRTIVDNLVSNAIKYSPRNATIELHVGVKDGFAVLDVIDEGRGVAPSDRSRIFESFYQGPPPAEGRVKGSGLGLAIAREYALTQGGRIEVAARGDGRTGAWFRLSLPLATASAARKPAPAAALASSR
jgi:two-component system sensor histidine kinase GlrK